MRLADNHKGWNVEVHTFPEGWVPINNIPFDTREEAVEAFYMWDNGVDALRIYEATN